MASTEIPLLIILLLGHFIADFSLQPSSWVEDRYNKHFRSQYLYYHAGIHGILSFAVLSLFVGISVKGFLLALAISGSHLIIDMVKSYTDPCRTRWFVIDQLMHLAVVVAVWIEVSNQTSVLERAWDFALSPKVLIGITAYFLVLSPFGILIGMICQKWAPELGSDASLKNAGRRIGQLERFLILTFILVGQFAAIGFLLAAKSVLRFGDTQEVNHRKINEYILLGTMTSFSLTIAFGLIVKTVIGKL